MGDNPKTEMLDFLLIPQSVKPREFKCLALYEKLTMTVFAPRFVSSPLVVAQRIYVLINSVEAKRLSAPAPD